MPHDILWWPAKIVHTPALDEAVTRVWSRQPFASAPQGDVVLLQVYGWNVRRLGRASHGCRRLVAKSKLPDGDDTAKASLPGACQVACSFALLSNKPLRPSTQSHPGSGCSETTSSWSRRLSYMRRAYACAPLRHACGPARAERHGTARLCSSLLPELASYLRYR